jgi:hypothetical protein
MKTDNRLRVVVMVFCLALVALTVLPSAQAEQWNRKTTVTFSEPVEVPGVGLHLLPAGTYVFTILSPLPYRHIVQISNVAEDHVFTTILAIPNVRQRATGKTVMTFKERGEGQPEAIRAWFYPGNEWGEEFVYPKSRAIELAKVTNEPVLATPVALDTLPVEELKTAPVVAVKPTGDEAQVAEVVEFPPEVAAATQVSAAAPVEVAALPQTASTLPFVGLIGLLSLGAGFALWTFSKRTV